MKTKKKKCDGCEEQRYIWKNVMENSVRKRYCKGCWSVQNNSIKSKPTPIRKPIAHRSSRKKKEDFQYSKQSKTYKENHPNCYACIPNTCTHRTTDVHHKAGRIEELLLDQRYWLPVCRPCHDWIETHPQESRDLGYSVSKI